MIYDKTLEFVFFQQHSEQEFEINFTPPDTHTQTWGQGSEVDCCLLQCYTQIRLPTTHGIMGNITLFMSSVM